MVSVLLFSRSTELSKPISLDACNVSFHEAIIIAQMTSVVHLGVIKTRFLFDGIA